MPLNTDGSEPLVSVIIPVYNVVDYVTSCLESAARHGMEPGQVEILAVDDGSTDGTSELLDDLASRLPEVEAIHQPNSGGPGGPRNTGLDRARGRYVFFLDADDELTPNALRDLVSFADEHGSEVVLGKMGGLGGRRPPQSMFTRTVVDAQLGTDNLIRTLGPWKLYSRDLIERQSNRFPTHLKRGEDPPFVLRAYLGASRISVLAERDYYLIRDREDGSNLTKQPSIPSEALERALALIEVIAQDTEPGPVRDAAMWRPIQFNAPGVLGRSLPDLEEDEQARIVGEFRDAMMPLWNEEVAKHAKGVLGTKLRLALDGDHRLLSRFIEWDREHTGATLAPGDDGFVLALPEDLAAAIGAERLIAPAVKVEAKLSSLQVEGTELRLGITVTVPNAAALPAAVLRLRARPEGEEREFPLDALGRATEAGYELHADAVVDLEGSATGIWDLFVVLAFDRGEISRRLGGKRAKSVGTDPIIVPGKPGDQALALAYFTEGYGNLSVDVGFTLPKHAAPRATLSGVLTDPEGDTLILEVESPLPARVVIDGDEVPSEQVVLDQEQLSSTTVLVRLPTTIDVETTKLRVVSDSGDSAVARASGMSPVALRRPRQESTVPSRRRWFARRHG